MMPGRFKRFLALILTVMMVNGLLIGAGGTALALPANDAAENASTGVKYNDVATALNAAADGETVRMLADAELTNAIVYNRAGIGVSLDLNGYRIIRTVPYNGGETGEEAALFVSNGVLTISDATPAAQGYIEYANNGGLGGSGLNIGSNGSVKLLSGGILGTGQSVFAHDAGSRFEMSGGVVYGSGNHVGSEGIAAASPPPPRCIH